jgi:DNA-binding transcriptional LysR family regulator
MANMVVFLASGVERLLVYGVQHVLGAAVRKATSMQSSRAKMHAMDWDDVRMLLVLLESRNLHDAGKRLRVDRSTVSRRLTALEQRLGAQLFARTRDGLQPTAAAERVRPFAEKMASDAAAVEQAAVSDAAAATGVVRVATTEAIATMLVDGGLLSLSEHHPELLIELLTSNIPVDLLRGEADLALRLSHVRHASLRVRCVARLKIGLFAAPSYVSRRGRPTTPAALRGHDVIVPGGELARLPEARWLAARPGVRVVFRSSSVPTLQSAAARGFGIVPLTAAWGDRDRGLERLQLIQDIPDRALWLVTPPATATRAAVRIVANRIAEIFGRY